MGDGLLALAGGLSQGFSQGRQVAIQRQLAQEQVKLQQQRFKLEEKQQALQNQLLEQKLQQDPMGLLKSIFQPQGQQGAQPQGTLHQSPSPTQAPAQGPTLGGFRPESIGISSEGNVNLQLRQPRLQFQQITVPTPGGGTQQILTTFDPQTGTVVPMQSLPGVPTTEQRDAATVVSAFVQPSDPNFNQIVAAYIATPQESRDFFVSQLQGGQGARPAQGAQGAAPRQAGGRGQPGPSPQGMALGAREAKKGFETQRIFEEAGARKAAEREFGELSQAEQQGITAHTENIANVEFLLNKYSDKEIETFVGLLNRPAQQAMLTARGVFGLQGSERFAEFKADAERIRNAAFQAGGKQLTPFEASVVFGFTPTGREAGGGKEFLAKARNLLRFSKASRKLRLDLARQAKGTIDPDELDKRLREEMKKIGGPGMQGQLKILSITPLPPEP